MIEKVAASHPNTYWWIKGDSVDVVKGLWESVKGVGAGDVDLDDGKLKHLYQAMQERLLWVNGIGLHDQNSSEMLKEDLKQALDDTAFDIEFIYSG